MATLPDYLKVALSTALTTPKFKHVAQHVRSVCRHDRCELLVLGLCYHCNFMITYLHNEISLVPVNEKENSDINATTLASCKQLAREFCDLANIPYSVSELCNSLDLLQGLSEDLSHLNPALLEENYVPNLTQAACMRPHLDQHQCPPCTLEHVTPQMQAQLATQTRSPLSQRFFAVCQRAHLDEHVCPPAKEVTRPCPTCASRGDAPPCPDPQAHQEPPKQFVPAFIDTDAIFDFFQNLAKNINVKENQDYYGFFIDNEAQIRNSLRRNIHNFGFPCLRQHEHSYEPATTEEYETSAPPSPSEPAHEASSLPATHAIPSIFQPKGTGTSQSYFDFSSSSIDYSKPLPMTSEAESSMHPSAPTFKSKPELKLRLDEPRTSTFLQRSTAGFTPPVPTPTVAPLASLSPTRSEPGTLSTPAATSPQHLKETQERQQQAEQKKKTKSVKSKKLTG